MSDQFTIPELAKGLRVLGSPRVLGGPLERFLAPLIEARRTAARAQRWEDRLAAFDGERLGGALRAVSASIASGLHPDDAPDRRALAARLSDALDPVVSALRRADAAASAVREARDEGERVRHWDQWVRELGGVFKAADLAAETAGDVLRPTPGNQSPDVKRRVVRQGSKRR